jgi:hypothetical protein
MNGDPLLTGEPSVFSTQNFSSLPTIWEEDTDRAARDGLFCSTLPMLMLMYRTSVTSLFTGGLSNPCINQHPLALLVFATRIDRNRRPEEGQGLGPVGTAIIGNGRHGAVFHGGNPTLALDGYGVQGFTSSESNMRAGVYGEATQAEAGVRGESQESTGVVGQSHGRDRTGTRSGPGVLGIGPPVTAAPAGWPGVLGMPAALNPVGNGVEGRSPSGWAGLFRGPVWSSAGFFVGPAAAKSAAVPHPDGSHRTLYSLESPESWFEDFGRAELVDGEAEVELDPDFAAVSDVEADYHVFLTPEDESNGLFVSSREPEVFTVREQRRGKSTLTFSYRIVAKRKDLDAERLAEVEIPDPLPDDQLLEAPGLPVQDVPSAGWDHRSPEEWPPRPPEWPEGETWPPATDEREGPGPSAAD